MMYGCPRRKSSTRGRYSFADYLSWNPAPSVVSTLSNNSSYASLIHSDAWKAVLEVVFPLLQPTSLLLMSLFISSDSSSF